MNYNKDKELRMEDVHKVFLDFVRFYTLTLTERIFVEYLWEYIKNELMKKG